MKYAIFDENGLPLAFYSPEINKEMPLDVVEITDDQWETFINNPGQRKWKNGEVISYEDINNTTNVPIKITRRQCALELLQRNYITYQEAIDLAASGVMPKIISDFFAPYSIDEKITAAIDLASFEYYSDDKIITTILEQLKYTIEDIDNFYTAASKR